MGVGILKDQSAASEALLPKEFRDPIGPVLISLSHFINIRLSCIEVWGTSWPEDWAIPQDVLHITLRVTTQVAMTAITDVGGLKAVKTPNAPNEDCM